MKQILQSLRTGQTQIADVPAPGVQPGRVLIRTARSLVSVGTERMLVEFGRAGWIQKARSQPDKVRMVIEKVKTDGLVPTFEAVTNKLDQPLALGYSNAGTVVAVGEGVSGFAVGDRVVSNGKHAEVVSVPANLCAKIPDDVSFDRAAFTVVAAIGLQGIRLIEPTLGESVVVTGLGLIGLLTVQLLRAQGCRVLGMDFDAAKLRLAQAMGAEVVNLAAGEDPIAAAQQFSRGRGVDAVVITASTKSNEPVHQSALMCRKRGRIVLVGVTGLELSRADFYEKELSFQVSCSYGPGRYDPTYEERGVDYPIGFVRWTEQRNFEAVLDMLSTGQLNVDALIAHRFPIAEAEKAYDMVASGGSALGLLIDYPEQAELEPAARAQTISVSRPAAAGRARLAFIGSGNYAGGVLIPAFKEAGAVLRTVVSAAGVSGTHAARKFGFEQATTDARSVSADPTVDAVVIATRHDTHAALCLDALSAGKHVFVEKPLALRMADVDRIAAAHAAAGGAVLTVGFNRRFAPHVVKIKSLLAAIRQPKAFTMTVNAGAIPREHWTQDPAIGGGRIIGEACHFIDLLRHLAGAPIAGFTATALGSADGTTVDEDKAVIVLRFADGSLGTIQYLANGHKSFPKERLEIFAAGRILQLDNFRRLRSFGWPDVPEMRLWRQDKGQRALAAAFVAAVEGKAGPPIPHDEIFEVSRVSVQVAEAIRAGASGMGWHAAG